MGRVTKAVIPAAGLGTRFLPATKAQPKEMLPVVDRPAIQYVVEEAVKAGIDDILIITGRNKRSLEDHFDRNFELAERKVPLSSMFEVEVKGNADFGTKDRRVLVKEAERTTATSRIIELKVDTLIPDGAKLKVNEAAFRSGILSLAQFEAVVNAMPRCEYRAYLEAAVAEAQRA